MSSPNSLYSGAWCCGNFWRTRSNICSPVTGIVIKVNVKPGQEIQAGDLMIVLEAMKMETSITAHQAGKVKSVNVAAGDPVKVHQSSWSWNRALQPRD